MSRSMMTRRTVLASTTLLAAGVGVTAKAIAQGTEVAGTSRGEALFAYVPEESDFPFEIQRTPEEWREHLEHDEEAYRILRQGGTETPKSTDLWLSSHDAGYKCRGCDLPVYEARWYQPLDKGWVFFHHAIIHSVLLGIDGPVAEYGQAGMLDETSVVSEVHCRRCGSHLGHHLKVSGMYLHCINGNALTLA